jgi:hypothetical protein
LHIQALSTAWPNLELLSDFMKIGTTRSRWSTLGQKKRENLSAWDAERDQRAEKTNVCRLDYSDTGSVTSTDYTDIDQLRAALNPNLTGIHANSPSPALRLYVIEDLSRDVIEVLGAHYDIEPAFFRYHIVEYAWYNVRDPWRDPPNLDVVVRKQNWVHIRYATGRYFEKSQDFKDACEIFNSFNVLRRPDDDTSNKSFWDEDDAIVAMTRSKASLWWKPGEEKPKIGMSWFPLHAGQESGATLTRPSGIAPGPYG